MATLRVSEPSELTDHVGADLGKSEWVVVDQSRIDAFAAATGDHQWIHVDVERAKAESPFGGPIAHGYLTLALAPALLPQLVEIEKCSRIINYGVDRLRMKEPVAAGSRVRMGAKLTQARQITGGGVLATLALVFEVEGTKRPAATGEIVYVYYR